MVIKKEGGEGERRGKRYYICIKHPSNIYTHPSFIPTLLFLIQKGNHVFCPPCLENVAAYLQQHYEPSHCMYMYLGYSLKSRHVSRPINSDKAKESAAGSNQKSLKYYYSFCYSTVHIKSTSNHLCPAISLQSSIMLFFIFISIFSQSHRHIKLLFLRKMSS